jgi:hypothetical protein
MKPATPKTDLLPSTYLRKAAFGDSLIKRLLTLIVVLGLVAWRTGLANANELSNGLLDATSISSQVSATPTGWIVNASRAISGPFNDGASSEGFANFADPGGQGLFFKPFQGNPANGNITVHLFQDNPGTPGMQYTLTGFAGAEANYSGLIPASPTRSELAVEFLNAGSLVIGGSVLDLQAAGLGTPNGNPFGYAQYTVMATAPAGTASVRARASTINGFNNPLGGGQAFVVDAFELTAIPEPSTIALGIVCLLCAAAFARRR